MCSCVSARGSVHTLTVRVPSAEGLEAATCLERGVPGTQVLMSNNQSPVTGTCVLWRNV